MQHLERVSSIRIERGERPQPRLVPVPAAGEGSPLIFVASFSPQNLPGGGGEGSGEAGLGHPGFSALQTPRAGVKGGGVPRLLGAFLKGPVWGCSLSSCFTLGLWGGTDLA